MAGCRNGRQRQRPSHDDGCRIGVGPKESSDPADDSPSGEEVENADGQQLTVLAILGDDERQEVSGLQYDSEYPDYDDLRDCAATTADDARQ